MHLYFYRTTMRSSAVLICCCLFTNKSAALRRRSGHPPNIRHIITNTRGGGDEIQGFGHSRKQDLVVQFNPEYENSHSTFVDESHTEWLQRQTQMEGQRQFQSNYQNSQAKPQRFNSFSLKLPQASPLLQRIQAHFSGLHNLSPSLFWTTITCMLVFGAWHIPRQLFPKPQYQQRFQDLLLTWFINSRANLRATLGLSLFLSALSHVSFFHLLQNLVMLSFWGPRVAQLLQQQRFYQQYQFLKNMTPLLLSSAMASNIVYLVGRPKGSSIGLSGVIASILSIQARALPDQVFRCWLLGIYPMTFYAKDLLHLLLSVSFFGTLLLPESRIAHLVHLGGLLHGIFYYDLLLPLFSPTRRSTLRLGNPIVKWDIRKLLPKQNP